MNKRKLMVSIMAGIMAAIMLLSLILSIIPTPASAASSSEIKNQINELKKQQEDLKDQQEDVKNQYEQNEDEIADMVNQKLLIDQEIFLLYEQINVINQQLSAFNLLIADKQDELDEAKLLQAELFEKNRERIRAMEENGTMSYWAVLFKAKSFSDFLDRLAMIDEIAAADRRRLREMSEAAEQVAEAQAALQSEKDEVDLTKQELDAAYAELQAKSDEAQALIDQLVAKGFELEDLYAQYEDEEKELLADIAQKEQEYLEQKELEWIAYWATYVPPTTAPPPTEAPTTPPTTGNTETQPPQDGGSEGGSSEGGSSEGGSAGGSVGEATEPTEAPTTPPATETEPPEENKPNASEAWRVPCSYTKLTSPFGDREAPTEGASTNHKGVDLAGPEGTPIYASRGGKVTIAKFSSSAGYYVTINHGDGFSSVYMHMTHYVVEKGDTVSGGQLIGYMGSTGISTGSHLHFSIIHNGTYVNPAHYVYLHP